MLSCTLFLMSPGFFISLSDGCLFVLCKSVNKIIFSYFFFFLYFLYIFYIFFFFRSALFSLLRNVSSLVQGVRNLKACQGNVAQAIKS